MDRSATFRMNLRIAGLVLSGTGSGEFRSGDIEKGVRKAPDRDAHSGRPSREGAAGLGETPRRKTCEAMKGLLSEAETMMSETPAGAGLSPSAQA
jgi:hypothetical protein